MMQCVEDPLTGAAEMSFLAADTGLKYVLLCTIKVIATGLDTHGLSNKGIRNSFER